MNTNIGSRVIRVVVAVLVAILFFANIISGIVAIVLLALAGVFILTGIFGFCPLCQLFGVSTKNRKVNKV